VPRRREVTIAVRPKLYAEGYSKVSYLPEALAELVVSLFLKAHRRAP